MVLRQQEELRSSRRDNKYTSKVAYLLDFWKEKRKIDVRLMSEYQKISGCPIRAAAFLYVGKYSKSTNSGITR